MHGFTLPGVTGHVDGWDAFVIATEDSRARSAWIRSGRATRYGCAHEVSAAFAHRRHAVHMFITPADFDPSAQIRLNRGRWRHIAGVMRTRQARTVPRCTRPCARRRGKQHGNAQRHAVGPRSTKAWETARLRAPRRRYGELGVARHLTGFADNAAQRGSIAEVRVVDSPEFAAGPEHPCRVRE